MRNKLIKAASLMTAALMAVSVASCDLFHDMKEDVIAAADEAATVMLHMDVEGISSVTDMKKSEEEELEEFFSSSSLPEDVLDVIRENSSYYIDEESCRFDKDEESGSVDVYFEVPDIDSLLGDPDITNEEELLAAVREVRNTDILMTMEFEQVGNELFLKNFDSKEVDQLYSFVDDNFIFASDVISAASTLSEAYLSLDGSVISQYILADSLYDADSLEYLMELTASWMECYQEAILEGMSCEVDEDSLILNGDTGTIDVVFTYPDYESVTESGFFTSYEDLADAIRETDLTIERRVTYEFASEDDGVRFSDFEGMIGEVLFFMNEFDPSLEDQMIPSDMLASKVDHTEWWWGEDDGTYIDTPAIELCIVPTDDASDYAFPWSFYYEVYYGDDLIYVSPEMEDCGSYIEASLSVSECPGLIDDNGLLFGGTYGISFYAMDGTLLASDSTEVTNTESGSFTGDITVPDINGITQTGETIIDPNVTSFLWYDMERGAVYDTDSIDGTDLLGITVVATFEDDPDEVYYEYYYNNGHQVGPLDPVYEDYAYFDGSSDEFFLMYYETLEPGLYMCMMYEDVPDNNDPASAPLLAYSTILVE